jgi:uncharacterized sulfatase
MKRLLILLVGIPLVLVLVALLVLALRLGGYEQSDDRDRLADKRDYLGTLSTVTPVRRPNIVIVLLDDLGYGDLGAYGAQSIDTPNIDSLAAGGMRFTHYYSPSPVCSPSRAGLLTGRYPPRAGLGHVVFPEGHMISNGQKISGLNTRLPAEEILLSEMLAAVGYNTGMVGKWHLGDVAPSLPNDFGFQSYYGALYSNDMKPFPLYRDRDIEEPAELDQTRLHGLYTREVVSFIEAQDVDTPFFLYYAHTFPHIPLYSSPEQAGRSRAGLYGDVVEDIDTSVGAMLDALRQGGLMNNTLILFTSDNGPWYEGSPGYVRGRKNQTWEGGQRVPFIAFWADGIAPGTRSDALVSGVDVLPTIAGLLGLPLPADRVIDGADLSALLRGGEAPDRLLYYYSQSGVSLDAVRDQRFKYHRRRGVRAIGLTETIDMKAPQGPLLFDLENDPQESYNVVDRYPAAAARLREAFEAREAALRDNLRGWVTVVE